MKHQKYVAELATATRTLAAAEQRAPLRLLAETAYVTSDLSLAELARDDAFAGVHAKTLESWCRDGDWVAKRHKFQERWLHQVAEKIGDEIARNRIAQLRRLELVFERSMLKLERDEVEARSFEGLLSAVVRLCEVIDERRDQIVTSLPARPISTAEPAIRPRLTQDEAKAAAKVIMAMRREAVRAARSADESA